ncbi:MAG: DNA repair protein RadA [Gammaproteobacteria bacterium]|nr:DNA repair protein RadA [Gammaproteobacteria bacterium]NIR84753.1 DNA repair protein RadA [Gammaproteobacteria bacterium]NIR91249.1 DNA repair protein RadA [Gammaproteobacteria bacterium]NIU05796.1 DNA repair protein RadA [Gammaproteobacteria bacterium]NIV52915.1 DNA repair protein RadA [Gammaproteobacteria bacterium]
MAREKLIYQCQSCGAQTPKWAGQCPGCGAWNTLLESPTPRRAAARGLSCESTGGGIHSAAEVAAEAETHIPTGMRELDRVLGGGLVPGSVVLIGGDPGIGKSTLLLQALARLARESALPSLYVTGEESLRQVVLRARRLGLEIGGLRLLAETQVERILDLAGEERPGVVVIDSIQTMYTEQLPSAPGGVGQVRESAAQLVRYAKHTGTALFLVGHVTKEGALAGPRVLEHMVDTVLYFEGEGSSRFRLVRAIKNRFGAVNELGVFAMTERGLREVSNPSAIFLSGGTEHVPGSVIMVTREGTRPMLVEVQALVDGSHLAQPRRVSVGLDHNRLAMLLAVLSRHGGVATHDQDVFVNVVGGVRVSETAADLCVVLAVLSSLRGRPLPTDLVTFGEVGLAGEIRPVPGGEERLREAGKHGFQRAVVPRANAPRRALKGMEVTPVARLQEALEMV